MWGVLGKLIYDSMHGITEDDQRYRHIVMFIFLRNNNNNKQTNTKQQNSQAVTTKPSQDFTELWQNLIETNQTSQDLMLRNIKKT